jgi:acetyl esterase/lipase
MKEIVDDLPLALNYIQKNAARWNVSPTRIGFSGFSAGCHLALMHADKARSVACFFPPTDFLNWGGPGLAPPKVLAEELGREYSPLYRITAAHPPTLLIHGDADKLVPLQQSSTYIEQLKSQNVNSKLTIVPGKGHGWPTIFSDLNLVADWFDATIGEPRQ